MKYGEIKNCDIANGIGTRVSLFVSGCHHHCKGCFNPQTWDFDFGLPFTEQTEKTILNLLMPSYIHGLSILGGEPFECENQKALIELLKKVRLNFPNKDVWCYSGYTLEEILGQKKSRIYSSSAIELLGLIDVLVDGRFVESKKDIRLKFRGSSNQRIIDVQRSLKENKTVLFLNI